MPLVFCTVKSQAGIPCLDFQVSCPDYPLLDIKYAPPYFWFADQPALYVLQVTSTSAGSGVAVAQPTEELPQTIRVNVALS